jgi:hypothetical protein
VTCSERAEVERCLGVERSSITVAPALSGDWATTLGTEAAVVGCPVSASGSVN